MWLHEEYGKQIFKKKALEGDTPPVGKRVEVPRDSPLGWLISLVWEKYAMQDMTKGEMVRLCMNVWPIFKFDFFVTGAGRLLGPVRPNWWKLYICIP